MSEQRSNVATASRIWPYVPIRALENFLDNYAQVQPPPTCWLSGDHAEAGDSYCGPCAEKAVEAGKGESVDGGYYGCGETDHCEHCTTCGQLLDYRLTNEGGASEIEHFRTITFDAPPSPDEAYHLARMLGPFVEQEEACAIAERAIVVIMRMQP